MLKQRFPAFVFALIALMVMTPVVVAQSDADREALRAEREEKLRKAKRERLWKYHYPQYARMYQFWNEDYYFFPTYKRSQSSSLDKTIPQLKKDFTVVYTRRTKAGVITMKKVVDTPADDYKPVMMVIPHWSAGSYGYFNSARIEKIEDNGDVILKDLKLMDWSRVSRDRSDDQNKVSNEFRRLGGVKTSASDLVNFRFAYRDRIKRFQDRTVSKDNRPIVLKDAEVEESPGATWKPKLQLAIIEMDAEKITAVPLKKMRQVRTEAEFLDILEGSGSSKSEFIDVVERLLQEAIDKRLPAEKHVRDGVLEILGEKVPEGFNQEFDLDIEL